MQLLAWYNVFFYVSLAVGLLLLIGSAVGLLAVDADIDAGGDIDADHDLDIDADHDLDADADHGLDADADHDLDADADHAEQDLDGDLDGDHDADGRSNPLDVGRIPFSLLLMMATLIFGTVGVISNLVLEGLLPPVVFGALSLGLASVVSLVLTKRLARLILRVVPATETYNVTRASFRGCTGELTVATDASFGAANLTDREGNIHTVTCKTIEGELPKGTRVLVVDYLHDEGICIVEEASHIGL